MFGSKKSIMAFFCDLRFLTYDLWKLLGQHKMHVFDDFCHFWQKNRPFFIVSITFRLYEGLYFILFVDLQVSFNLRVVVVFTDRAIAMATAIYTQYSSILKMKTAENWLKLGVNGYCHGNCSIFEISNYPQIKGHM